jgi:TRAP-type mannitol/chloroaromatic compound transport system permease small subunit
MKAALKFVHGVEWINRRVGLVATWLVLLACLVSALNAGVRYTFGISSNAWLELQWYMFAGMVMLGAPAVLSLNEHVRVDVFYGKFPSRVCAWIDILGSALFLLPMAGLILWLSWPLAWESYATGEMSSQAQGLIRWPAKMAIPVGAALLALQGVAEILKRLAYLRGQYNMDTHYEKPLQ